MSSITKQIITYQKYIECHPSEEIKVLQWLEKLHALDVRVQHLQDTGVGRTVNALRKEPGEVGASAKALVSKWKKMVAAEEESSEEEPVRNPNSSNHDDEDEQNRPGEYEPRVTLDERQTSHSDQKPMKQHEKKDGIRSDKSRSYSSSDSDNHNNKRLKDASYDVHKRKNREQVRELVDHKKTSDSDKQLNDHKSSHRNIDDHTEQRKNPNLKSTLDSKIETEQIHKSSNSKSKTDSGKSKHHESSHHKSHENKVKSHSKSSESSKRSSHTRYSDEYKKTSRDLPPKADKDGFSASHDPSKDISSPDKYSKPSDKHKHKELGSSKSESKGKHDSGQNIKSSKEKNSLSISDKGSREKNSENHKRDSNHEKSRSKTSSKSTPKSSSSSNFSSDNIKNKSEPKKRKIEDELTTGSDDEGIGFNSGASFEEALGMASPLKIKKKNPVKEIVSPVDVKKTAATKDMIPVSLLAPTVKLNPLPPLEISALPEISPNYKPRPPPKLAALNQEEALSVVMSTKNQRTKVYSGNRVHGALPSLYEMCVMVLQQHIDALEYTGGVPYDILKPIVDKATPEQLFSLEHYNAYLTEDTGELWKKHCAKEFKNKQRLELESWREMYMRCQEEREAKLKSLTANIKLSQEVKMAPTRQTKMAYVDAIVKPPRGVARKQAIHGTASLPVVSPAARVAALAGNNVVRPSVGRTPTAAASSVSGASFSSSHKIKKAPLMLKALQFMRSGRGGKR